MPKFIKTAPESKAKTDGLAIISSKIDSLSKTIAEIRPSVNVDNSEVLDSVSEILKAMRDYNLKMMEAVAKTEKPKKWDFKVEYSMLGKIKAVKAVAIEH